MQSKISLSLSFSLTYLVRSLFRTRLLAWIQFSRDLSSNILLLLLQQVMWCNIKNCLTIIRLNLSPSGCARLRCSLLRLALPQIFSKVIKLGVTTKQALTRPDHLSFKVTSSVASKITQAESLLLLPVQEASFVDRFIFLGMTDFLSSFGRPFFL